MVDEERGPVGHPPTRARWAQTARFAAERDEDFVVTRCARNPCEATFEHAAAVVMV